MERRKFADMQERIQKRAALGLAALALIFGLYGCGTPQLEGNNFSEIIHIGEQCDPNSPHKGDITGVLRPRCEPVIVDGHKEWRLVDRAPKQSVPFNPHIPHEMQPESNQPPPQKEPQARPTPWDIPRICGHPKTNWTWFPDIDTNPDECTFRIYGEYYKVPLNGCLEVRGDKYHCNNLHSKLLVNPDFSR